MQTIKRQRGCAVVLLLAFFVALFSAHRPVSAQVSKNQQPIHIINNDGINQKVLATITGLIFGSMGYQVQYSFSTTNEQLDVNSVFHYDCGNPKNSGLKKAARAQMPTLWPCAFQTLQQISFDNKAIAPLTAKVDDEKLSYQQAASGLIITALFGSNGSLLTANNKPGK
ncbi:MAG: hypothetical protein ACI9FJ_001656 [Alteromonadaceae bacterium]|jgi:hypothetical protein